MKKFIIFSLITFMFFSCNIPTKERKNQRIILHDIIFADGFDNDEILLEINGNKIVKQTLSSDKIVGLASLSYQIVKDDNKAFLVNSEEEDAEQIMNVNQGVEISVLFEKEWYKVKVDTSYGRYILIDVDSIIIFTQQKKRPVFD